MVFDLTAEQEARNAQDVMDFFESKATLDKIEQKPYNYSHGKETSKISEEISKTEGGVDNKISWKVLEKRFPEVISAISGRIKSPVKEIHTLEDAARHGYDYLIKYPQEQLLATITDKEGKILSTHFLSKGDRASSQIDLKEIAGIATREKGADRKSTRLNSSH